MKKNKQIFISAILILMFFGLGGQKASAAGGAINWNWGPTGEKCWSNFQSVNFEVTENSLDSNGDFWANISGSSSNGATYMYLDWTPGEYSGANKNKCVRYSVYPIGTKIFNTDNSAYADERHNFGPLPLGQHSITCWGFANETTNSAFGSCSFGQIPSCTLQANPAANIPIGGSSELSWTAKDTVSAVINPGNINIAPLTAGEGSGKITVNSSTSGENIYVMTVTGINSAKTCQANFTVDQPSCIFTAAQPSISYGNKVALSWKTVGVTSAKIDNGNDNSNDDNDIKQSDLSSGSISVGPLIKTTYTMIADTDGGKGRVVCSPVTIDVIAPPPQNYGLIPCARLIDNLNTSEINESAPCDICSVFYMLKNIINFIMTMSIGVGIFILVIIGLIYVFSGGSLEMISFAKTAINSVISGISIIFIVWVTVAIILHLMGYGNMSKWNQVSCGLAATPSQVNDLAITVGNDQVILSWAPPLLNNGDYPVDNYHVYRSSSTNTAYSLITAGNCANLGGNLSTCTDTGLTNGATYYYKVLAVNKIGEGSQPSEVSTMSDCSAANSKTFQSKIVATDADHDGYPKGAASQQCVGASKTDADNGKTYYKNAAGDYQFIDSVFILPGAFDCNDSDPIKWRNRYNDSDGDHYCSSNMPECVGNETGYVDSCVGYTDCAVSDNTKWQILYFDKDGDGYGFDPAVCVGNDANYVNNNTDCDPDNGYIYQLKNVVNDKDQDGYSITKLLPAPAIDSELKPGCVGDSKIIKNTNNTDRTYYKNEVGNFEFVDSAQTPPISWLNKGGEPDCAPDNVNIYWLKNVAIDADQDGYSASAASGAVSNQCVGDFKMIHGRKYYKISAGNSDSDFIYIDESSMQIGGVKTDCNDNNNNIYQNQNVAADTDQDGHSVAVASIQCVGLSATIDGRTYYKNSIGNFNQILSGSIISTSDCADSDIAGNSNIYQTLNATIDADHDNYSAGTVSATTTCVGDPSPTLFNERTYYKNSAGAYPFMISAPAGIDCDDSTDAKWRNRFQDSDGDIYCSSGNLVCVGNETGYRDSCFGYADCNDNDKDKWVYLYHDGDKDGYGAGSAVCVGNDANYINNNIDCDDNNKNINPAAIEICNNKNDNCIGGIDEGVTGICTTLPCNKYGIQTCVSGVWGSCNAVCN